MRRTIYRKDTKKFWQERTEARKALDKERADAPFCEKIAITEKLRIEAITLRSAKRSLRKP